MSKFVRLETGQRILNIVGKKYNQLTAIEFIKIDSHGSIFKFECACGNTTDLRGTLVTTGQQKNCGCKVGKHNKGRTHTALSLSRIGERHHLLTIIDVAQSNNKEYRMVCKCLCGNSKQVKCAYSELLKGKVKSCGCWQKEMASKTGSLIGLNNNKQAGKNKWVYKNIFMRSGLEVIYAKYLDSIGVNWLYEPKIFKLSNGLRYNPDFYLLDSNLWVEVKGYLTEQESVKIKLFQDTGESLKIYYLQDIERITGLSYRKFLKEYKNECIRHG
jgi:hypothetical protein